MDNRLITCAKLCKGDFIADIGTDHGYLPCYMVSNGMCKKAYACDTAIKPLNSAVSHIKEQGLEDRITAILSDGLDNVPAEGITDIVMAGMGGELIASLINKCSWAKNENLNFILQPMTKIEFLREYLYKNNFKIDCELACAEGKFMYTVMRAVYSKEDIEYQCDDEYIYFGKVDTNDKTAQEYILHRCRQLSRAAEGMMSSNTKEKESAGRKILEICNKKLNETEKP